MVTQDECSADVVSSIAAIIRVVTPRISQAQATHSRSHDSRACLGELAASLAETIDARDPYTYGHSARVSFYAGLLGERIGLDDRTLRVVASGGLFHDIGKVVIPNEILAKPDNVPIPLLIYSVGFTTWVALRRAVINDERMARGEVDQVVEQDE